MNIVALVPARSGSKRVLNKNIRKLGGIPLIGYTVLAAKRSSLVDRIIVTTDSEEIAKIAVTYGAEAPFLRPENLAGDDATEFEYHLLAMNWLKSNEQYDTDLIVNLYPTTPFRTTESIDKGIRLMAENPDADSLRSAKKCSEHPYKMWITNGDTLTPFVDDVPAETHTFSYHLLPKIYIQNASIYISRKETLLRFGNTIGEKVVGLIMDDVESIDINSELDFALAEHHIESNQK